MARCHIAKRACQTRQFIAARSGRQQRLGTTAFGALQQQTQRTQQSPVHQRQQQQGRRKGLQGLDQQDTRGLAEQLIEMLGIEGVKLQAGQRQGQQQSQQQHGIQQLPTEHT